MARALGGEHRLDLIEHLAQGEQSVEALAKRTGMPFANTSQHLQALRRVNLVVAASPGGRPMIVGGSVRRAAK